jgi:hypothetical protein
MDFACAAVCLHKQACVCVCAQLLIETRSRCGVSVAAGNPRLEQQHAPQPKHRPVSAPATHQESAAAQLSAGNTPQQHGAGGGGGGGGRYRPKTSPATGGGSGGIGGR